MIDSNAAPVRLGLMPPLTGVVALYGAEIVAAASIACDEVNAAGGVLGRRLELVVEDDGSLPDSAVPAALRLLDRFGCTALVGNLLSSSRIAVASQVAEPRRVPYLNFSFYEGSIRGRYFFHFAALPNQQIDKMIPWMARRYGLKMFFAGNNYEWPRGSIDAAKHALVAAGGEIVGEQYLELNDSDAAIDKLLALVAHSGADVFVPYFAGDDQIRVLNRFAALGLKQRMAVVMGHYDEVMVGALAPAVREGLYSSNTYFMSVDIEANRRFLARLAEREGVTGIWPHGNGVLTNFGEGAYVCVRAFARAANAAGTLDAEALVAALEQVALDAPQGRVTMDSATHHAHVNTYLARCAANGEFDIVERFGCSAPAIPARYAGAPAPDVQHGQPAPAAARATASQILALADMAVLVTDADGTIVETNHAVNQLFGYGDDELAGMNVNQLLPPHLRERHRHMMRHFVDGEQTERQMGRRADIMGYRKDGSFMPLEASIAKLVLDGQLLLVATLHDITDRKRAEQELQWRASHDELTGLPNRSLILERLASALQRSHRSGLGVAVFFIDLDGFKLVNDTHGHEAGDTLLTTVSRRMLDQMRPGDTLGRLAGDEFVVLCEQLEQPATISALAARLNAQLRQPCKFGNTELIITGSIGIAIGHGRSHTADDLLRAGDAAMYAVKLAGGDDWKFFDDSLQTQAQQKLTISQGLRHAIERGELSPRFQPIVDAASGHVVGAELLLRWQRPQGEVAPTLFIPVAEAIGVIVPIGLWVFRAACEAQVRWHTRWGAQAPYVSVNVSARQLSATLADEVAAILQQSGADPARILLEITESALMADVENNLRALRRLAEIGLRLAVDDFGTGYSSLAQLTRMPVNVLKIDRAFVDGIDKPGNSLTVIHAIIGLGRALGLKLVAEGVETEAQLAELRASGCDLIQGFLFHRPLERDAFEAVLARELGPP